MSKKTTVALSKHREKRTTLKNSLLHPYCLSWPHLPKQTTSFIVGEVNRLFSSLCPGTPEKSKTSVASFKAKTLKQITLGLREVTKSLEKDHLSLVLVCQSTKPVLLTNHILVQAAEKNIKACCVPGLGSALVDLLDIPRTSVIGFHKHLTNSSIQVAVENICSQVQPISMPWKPSNKSFAEEEEIPDKKLKQLITTKICINQVVV